jgi:ATP-binding cassette subfamily F protein uup
MTLIALDQIAYGTGGPLLLDHVQLSLVARERVALVGRNGAGKSTLLRLLAGEIRPDDGQIRRRDGLRVSLVPQEVPQSLGGSVREAFRCGLGELGEWIARYEQASARAGDATDDLATLHARIDAADGWTLARRSEDALAGLGLDPDADFAALSGGMKRRVLLAAAMVAAPDLLLLDEPTNHLDLDAIEALERAIRASPACVVFVTHDRRFLRNLATRIVEVDRGALTSWPGDWDEYLRRRDERAHAESREHARFDKLLAQEEVWIRQGIKARRVRDEGRVRRLEAMRRERAERRERTGSVRMDVATADAGGKRVLEARAVTFSRGERCIVRDFSCLVLRGDRIGVIGANGSGKTTLIRLLLGELAPDQGEVRTGTGLAVAYFDQYRETLREDQSALDNVAEGSDFVDINGRRTHVLSWLQDFLFTAERARAPITRLSGGERHRLLLARLFARPSNLLVMDEPTNDLDVETLELLEERLADYPGTLIVVSHDRDFLDRVVTSTLVMEGDGRIGEYVGGYSDWVRQRPQPVVAPALVAAPAAPAAAAPAQAASARKRMSYKDARELEQLPARIEALEAELAALHQALQDPAHYQSGAAAIQQHGQRLAAAETELAAAYARWEALEAQANA